MRQQAPLDCPTFQVFFKFFRVLSESVAATLARSLIHGTHLVSLDFFLKIHLQQVNRQHPALEMCMPEVTRSLSAGRPVVRVDELERNTQNFAIRTPRFARQFSTWNSPSLAAGAYPQNCMVDQRRNQVSEMHFEKLPACTTFPVLGNELQNRSMFLFMLHFGKQCIGSKKWRWLNQWTISSHRSQLESVHFPFF